MAFQQHRPARKRLMPVLQHCEKTHGQQVFISSTTVLRVHAYEQYYQTALLAVLLVLTSSTTCTLVSRY
jgi:hypothetical protein